MGRIPDQIQRRIKDKKEILKQIKNIEKEKSTITLVYGAKDEKHNNAVILSDIIKDFK